MKNLLLLTLLFVLSGCMGARKYSKYDHFEELRVDQMSGNVVSGRYLGKTSLCLSARRESRLVTAITNTSVNWVTNQQVTYTTNVTISAMTNLLASAATNAVAALPQLDASGAAGSGDGQPIVVGAVQSPGSTNIVAATSGNLGVSRGNNQTTVSAQITSQHSEQVTATSNNVSVTTQISRNLTAETNLVISVVTNQTVVPFTNVAILSTNLTVRDYYLLTELLPPPEFTTQSGESLVLLVDGARHAFTPSNPQGVYVGRKGYISLFYRTSPEVLVAIANAREVRIRLKGVNQVIDRRMPRGARENFRNFMLKHFKGTPADNMAEGDAVSPVKVASSVTTHLE